MAPSPGSIGPYQIVGQIGRGGMAVVYLARQPTLSRSVALKELAPFHAADPSLTQRFLREARLAGSLNHPNVVTVYDFLEHDGVPYIAMEYLDRGSLRPFVGRLSLAQMAGVLEGLLAALSHAETMGIVHRDIKPENILVTADGGIKLADFGIAKAYQQIATEEMLTPAGATVGTPAYMAPEQAMAEELGPWTDLYQTGVVAYELLAGAVPFQSPDGSPVPVLMQHISEPVPPLRGIDPALEAWVLRTLAKVPADRPAGARAAWEELEEIVIAALGPLWRRDARLRDPDPTAEHKPLTPAPFSGAQPTPDAPAAGTTWDTRPQSIPAPTPPGYAAPPAPPPREETPPEPTPAEQTPPEAAPAPAPPQETPPEAAPVPVWSVSAPDAVAPVQPPGPSAPPVEAAAATPVPPGQGAAPTTPPPEPAWSISPPEAPPRRRSRLIVPGAAGMVAAAAVAGFLLLGGDGNPGPATPTPSPTAASPTPTATPRATFAVGRGPDGIALGAGAVWVAASRGGTLTRIDPASGATASVDVGPNPDSVVVALGSVWVTVTDAGKVVRVSTDRRPQVLESIDVGARPEGIAASGRAIWVTNSGDGTLTQIIASTGETHTVTGVGRGPVDVAIGAGAVWVANSSDGTVARVDGGRRELAATIRGIGPNPRAVAIVGRDVWVATADDGRAWRIGGDSNAVTGSVKVGGTPRDIATDGEHLWVSDRDGDRVVEIDPDGMRVVRRQRVAGGPLGVAVDDRAIWVTRFDDSEVTRRAR